MENFLGLEYKGYKIDLDEFKTNAQEIADSIQTKTKILNRTIQYHCQESVYPPIKTSDYFKETGIRAYRELQDNGTTHIKVKNYHTAPVHILAYSLIGAKDSMILLYKASVISPFITQPGEGEIQTNGTHH